MGRGDRYIIHGIYAGLINEYIEFKRALGYKMEDTERKLATFDRLTIKLGESKIGISKELFRIYWEKQPGESYSNLYQRLSTLKAFSAFLQLKGYDSYIPKLPPRKSSFKPYIFTDKEIETIFKEADKLYCSTMCKFSIKCAIPCLLRLLYCSGPRLGEALNLKHSDFNLDDGTLLIRASKNGEDRIIALSPTMREVLIDYITYKENCGLECASDDILFTAPDGTPCSHGSVYNHFRLLLYRAGIHHGGRGNGPRVHDLRHTFCVNALLKMSERGIDLYTSMPILMKYMGHKTIAATNRYVRITEEMFPKLLKKVSEIYSHIFPEINLESNEIYYSDEDD